MKRFLIIGDREKYGWMEDFVVLWIGQAENQKHALEQFEGTIAKEPRDIHKIIEVSKETEIPPYNGF
ncbi:MAG: hypothetical protein KKE96_07330 [Candidatus Altiarchaeota archaeon]|nr:hypothetical protein [Candidatus Altiarchaeota archaeon]